MSVPDEMVGAAMTQDGAVEPGRGLVLRAHRVVGARGLEPGDQGPARVPHPKAAGWLTEIITHQLRMLMPVGDAAPG